MKKLFLSISVISMVVMSMTGCAAKPKADNYYERANSAAQGAHDRLKND